MLSRLVSENSVITVLSNGSPMEVHAAEAGMDSISLNEKCSHSTWQC